MIIIHECTLKSPATCSSRIPIMNEEQVKLWNYNSSSPCSYSWALCGYNLQLRESMFIRVKEAIACPYRSEHTTMPLYPIQEKQA